MILRPLQAPPPASSGYLPAWQVVERMQKQKYQSCWMITQPSHAALAGDIAAKLQASPIPSLDADLIRAIALHDAGWGIPDAQAITRSRARLPEAPKSFLEIALEDVQEAWTQSIQVAQSTGSVGGYMVSRHFQHLAEHRIDAAIDKERDRKKLHEFVVDETQRQKRLGGKPGKPLEELESLADVLQFCDLLSLYMCSGARDNVEFPEYFGFKLRVFAEGKNYRFDPAVMEQGTRLSVAALRFPETNEISSTAIEIEIA